MIADVIIVGAGITGISAARYLAGKHVRVLILEKTSNVGGLCRESYYKNTRYSLYGPHIFHTNDDEVWKFLIQFTDFTYYTHFVKSYDCGKLWDVPISAIDKGIGNEMFIKNLEQRLYENYTKKMWGEYYEKVRSRTLERMENKPYWDNRYFKDRYQGFPKHGYNQLFETMLSMPNISVWTNVNAAEELEYHGFIAPIIYTGRLDRLLGEDTLPFKSMWFDYDFGGSFPWSNTIGQINFPSDYDFIRACSSKILYKQDTKEDVVCFDYPRGVVGNLDCYPVVYGESLMNAKAIEVMVKTKYPTLIPAGRAGTFSYMNMDQAVRSGLDAAKIALEKLRD